MQYPYIFDRSQMYWQFYFTTIIFLTNKAFKERYVSLRKIFVKYLERKKMNDIICHREDKQIYEKIVALKEKYLDLFIAIRNWNSIIGWPIFFTIACNVCICLASINYIFMYSGSSKFAQYNRSLLIAPALNTGAYTVIFVNNIKYIATVQQACETERKRGWSLVLVQVLTATNYTFFLNLSNRQLNIIKLCFGKTENILSR